MTRGEGAAYKCRLKIKNIEKGNISGDYWTDSLDDGILRGS
jgi:hypothetical protein